MIAEALLRMRAVAPLADYSYVGFGARQFIDFSLFHRMLGVSDMTSIEKAESDIVRHRQTFNRPFGSVKLKFGLSTDVLPLLSWDRLAVVWLDYDDPLLESALRDIAYLGHKLVPASALIVTFNAHMPLGKRLETLRRNVEVERLKPGVTEEDLETAWAVAEEQYRIADAELAEAMTARTDGAHRRQIFNFCYKDGARMQTVGWLIDAPGVTQALDACKMDELDFTRTGAQMYEITVPGLTRKELAHLDQLMPAGEVDHCPEWLSPEDYGRYTELYRWYPMPSS